MKLRTLLVSAAGAAVAAGALGTSALAAETTTSEPTSATTTATSEPAPTTTTETSEETTTNQSTETTTKETTTAPTPTKVTAEPSATLAPHGSIGPVDNEEKILKSITTISVIVTTLGAAIGSLVVFINSIPGGREALRKFFK